MRNRDYTRLVREFDWAMGATRSTERALQHVFEVDLAAEFQYAIRTRRGRTVVREEFRKFVRAEIERARQERKRTVYEARPAKPGAQIVEAVCARHGVDPQELFRKVRFRGVGGRSFVARVRGEAIWLLRNSTYRYTYPECARFVGLTNHTSAIAAYAKFEAFLTADESRRAQLNLPNADGRGQLAAGDATVDPAEVGQRGRTHAPEVTSHSGAGLAAGGLSASPANRPLSKAAA